MMEWICCCQQWATGAEGPAIWLIFHHDAIGQLINMQMHKVEQGEREDHELDKWDRGEKRLGRG